MVAVAQPSRVRFHTVADSRYFVGLVTMVNSLRLTGHTQEVVVTDIGLTDNQRGQLAGVCQFVRPTNGVRNPLLLKSFSPQLSDGINVIIDTDIIVAGSLEHLFSRAEAGRVCTMADPTPERWCAEWHDLLDLRAPLRRQPYVNTGFVVFSSACYPDLLPRWSTLCGRVETILGSGPRKESPFANSDQDALNPLLMSELPPGIVEIMSDEAAPGAYGLRGSVRVVDKTRLRCAVGDEPTLVLHYWGKPKPWQAKPGRGIRRDAYRRLLRRLLTRPDVAVVPRREHVPFWLRPGPVGAAAYWAQVGLGQVRRVVQGVRRGGRQARRRVAPSPT